VDDVVVGRFVTIGLAEGPVVRGRPAAGRCRLHHAESGVRTHVVVDALAAAHEHHLVRRIVPFAPLQRGRRRVLDLLVALVTALPLRRTARPPPPPPRVLRPVFFPVQTERAHVSANARVNTLLFWDGNRGIWLLPYWLGGTRRSCIADIM